MGAREHNKFPSDGAMQYNFIYHFSFIFSLYIECCMDETMGEYGKIAFYVRNSRLFSQHRQTTSKRHVHKRARE
jgi:hypothetical protein